MTPEISALVFIMETFLVRERVRFHKTISKTTNSAYFELCGPRFPFLLRISDHQEGGREFMRQADFHVRSADDIRAAQTSITARIIRPWRQKLAAAPTARSAGRRP